MSVISVLIVVAVGFNHKQMMNLNQQWEDGSSAIELRQSLLDKIEKEISLGGLVASFNTYLENGSKVSLSETKKSLDGIKDSLSQYAETEAIKKMKRKSW